MANAWKTPRAASRAAARRGGWTGWPVAVSRRTSVGSRRRSAIRTIRSTDCARRVEPLPHVDRQPARRLVGRLERGEVALVDRVA